MKRIVKKILLILLIATGCLLLAVGGYVGYMSIQYYRIGDVALTVTNNQTGQISFDTPYKAISYNVGFGAYTPEFSFFMDSGEMLDGTKVQGRGSVAKDKATVLTNTTAMKGFLESGNYDFIALQEVDTHSTRAHKVNMAEMLSLDDYATTFASNFHSPYLLYPFHSPHGFVNSGILSQSRFEVSEAYRKELPITTSFFGKFFDLDRCFSVQTFPLLNGKEFKFVNIHFTAYDEGGIIRAQQLTVLNAYLSLQASLGNYVVIAGDFHHDIADSLNLFPTQQKVPNWVSVMTNADLAPGYQLVGATNAPTCRSTDMAYTPGVNYTVVIDGFIVSNNIEVLTITNIDTGFAYSDHNPAELSFKLIE